MAIFLPGTAEELAAYVGGHLTPREMVAELDKHVVGQRAAKRAVAIALRNRMRRAEAAPGYCRRDHKNNIIMIGPTGVGKTEIARRLAKLTNSPFMKVEASKFTEVGYVGRDVESMIRDLVEIAVDMVREEKLEEVEDRAGAQRRGALARSAPASFSSSGQQQYTWSGGRRRQQFPRQARTATTGKSCGNSSAKVSWTIARWKLMCAERSTPSFEIISNQGIEEMDINLKDVLPNLFGQRTKKRKMKVGEAFEYLVQEEETRLVDIDQGIVGWRSSGWRIRGYYLPGRDQSGYRPGGWSWSGCLREGVQRDILPIVEGTTVNTRYGMVRTDHILFIAAGAFHVSKPSDLIPELRVGFLLGSSCSR